MALRANEAAFQSLGRDSVLLSADEPRRLVGLEKFQSLGRDSVLLSFLTHPRRPTHGAVSIPRSGFCFVEPHHSDRPVSHSLRFNPSVGILFC